MHHYPWRMGMTNLRQSLRKRYSGLTGELEEARLQIDRIQRQVAKLPALKARIVELEPLIAAAELLLRDNDPDWNPEETPALKPWTHHIPVPFGQCGRRGMSVLRDAQQPMTTRQVAFEVLRECGESAPDRETLKRVKDAIEATFRKFRGRSVEASGRYPMQWRAINKPEIEFDP